MAKCFENFMFGLCFGMGFIVAQNVLHFIGKMLFGA